MTRRYIRLESPVSLIVLLISLICTVSAHAARKLPTLTLQCPTYLIPGHRNHLHYRLDARTLTKMNGRLEIFRLSAGGDRSEVPLAAIPVQLQSGGRRSIILDGKSLPDVTGSYLVRITAGENDAVCAERRSQVKAWDLIGCFHDSLTEQEKRAIDKAWNELPKDYSPDEDPHVDDEAADEQEPHEYCSGMDSASVTAKQIAATAWYWDQMEQQAQRLHISDSVSSRKISAQDWLKVWGMRSEKKKWYDERGAVLYSLNSTFFTTNPGQFFKVRLFVSKDGALDNAGNIFGEDYKTGWRNGTILEKITIDGNGEVSSHTFDAVPHKDVSVYQTSPQPQEPRKVTRFERFYPIYLNHIAEIVAAKEQREAEPYRDDLARTREAEQKLVGHEEDELVELRALAKSRPQKRLWFDGESPEQSACIGSSDASARIFAQLMKEDLVSTESVLYKVDYRAELLSPAWVALVRDVLGRTEPHSKSWRRCSKILYRAGVNDAYRSELVQDALAQDDRQLYLLFFDSDPETCLPHVRRSASNDALLEKLCGKASKPRVRAVCAAYAAAIGNTELAETISIEVCNLQYIGKNTSGESESSVPREDDDLSEARRGTGDWPGVLDTLFYQVRSEKAFRIILERSDVERAIRFGNAPVPPEWRRVQNYSRAKWELELADSMIGALKDFGKPENRVPRKR